MGGLKHKKCNAQMSVLNPKKTISAVRCVVVRVLTWIHVGYKEGKTNPLAN